MQDDVTDVVRAVIDTGIADPDRICNVGWSYGGYAALAGAAFTPELYSCAVSIGAITDDGARAGHRASKTRWWSCPETTTTCTRAPCESGC
jgi:dipeptidyl aminopeptidase/acylaminoacyl peptidase